MAGKNTSGPFGPRADLLIQTSPGVFTQQAIIAPFEFGNFAAYYVVAAPLVGTRRDLAFCTSGPKTWVLLNQGTNPGDVWTQVDNDNTQPGSAIVFGKLRGGPPRDLVGSNDITGNLAYVLRNDGAGEFRVPEVNGIKDFYESPGNSLARPYGLDLGKLNNDQQNDLVVALATGTHSSLPFNDGHGGIAVLRGTTASNGDGPLWFMAKANIQYFPVEPLGQTPVRTPKPCFVKIADMNNDSLNDVVSSNNDSYSVSVLINQAPLIPNP